MVVREREYTWYVPGSGRSRRRWGRYAPAIAWWKRSSDDPLRQPDPGLLNLALGEDTHHRGRASTPPLLRRHSFPKVVAGDTRFCLVDVGCAAFG